MIARFLNFTILALILTLLLVGLATAAGLEDLMKEDEAAGQNEQVVADEAGSGLSLEELVGSPAVPADESRDTGSLLGGIERARFERKMQAAYDEFDRHQTEVLKRCQCVYRGDCPASWDSQPWPKSRTYLDNEADAIARKRRICDEAGAMPFEGLSIGEAEKRSRLAKTHRTQLEKIDSNMRNDAYWARERYEKDQEEQLAARRREERRLREQVRLAKEAREEAELAAAWSDWATSDQEFWQGIQATQDRAMADIRAAERAAQRAREVERQERVARQALAAAQAADDRMSLIVQTCAKNGGRYNHSANRCEPRSQPRPRNSASYEAEKQNCLNAGKKWNGSSCDLRSTIEVKGWKKGNRAYVQRSNPPSPSGMLTSSGGSGKFNAKGRKMDPGGPNGRGRSLGDLMDSGSAGSANSTSGKLAGFSELPKSGPRPSQVSSVIPSSPGGSGGGGSGSGKASDKEAKRMIFVFTDEESRFSWPSQDEACRYAKMAAIEKAKGDCREQFGGRIARQSEVTGPATNSMCHSYRQVKKTGFTSTKGQWKAKSKTSLQCILPDVPVANPVAPSAG